MKKHFCPAEKSIITYQGKCNWCGESEGSITQDIRDVLKLALEALQWSKPHKDAVITHSEAIDAIVAYNVARIKRLESLTAKQETTE